MTHVTECTGFRIYATRYEHMGDFVMGADEEAILTALSDLVLALRRRQVGSKLLCYASVAVCGAVCCSVWCSMLQCVVQYVAILIALSDLVLALLRCQVLEKERERDRESTRERARTRKRERAIPAPSNLVLALCRRQV